MANRPELGAPLRGFAPTIYNSRWGTRSGVRIWSRRTCVKLHAVLVPISAALVYFLPPSYALIFSGAIVGSAFFAIGIMEARRETLWLTPLTFFFFFFGVQLGPASLYMGQRFTSLQSIPFMMYGVSSDDVAYGFLITLIGTFAMHLGLTLVRPRPSRMPHSRYAFLPKTLFVLAVFWAIGTVALLRPELFARLGVLGGFLQFGPEAALFALAFAPRGAFRLSSRQFWTTFAIGTAVFVIAALFSGMKTNIMFALMPLFAVFVHRSELRKWVPIAVISGILSYLLVVAPIVNGARILASQHGEDFSTNVKYVLADPVSTLDANSLQDFFTDQLDAAMRRMFEFPQVCGFMLSEVRRTGFAEGATMSDWYYGLVPRIFWPEKPNVSRGAWFTAYLGFSNSAAEATTSTGMTSPGEWYWNFGIPGVIAGMFVTGLLMGGLWRLAGDYPIPRPINLLLYAGVTLQIVALSEAMSPIIGCIALYVVFGPVFVYRHFIGQRIKTVRVSSITNLPHARTNITR